MDTRPVHGRSLPQRRSTAAEEFNLNRRDGSRRGQAIQTSLGSLQRFEKSMKHARHHRGPLLKGYYHAPYSN